MYIIDSTKQDFSNGTLLVSGAKNAALPILVSSLLIDHPCTFKNVPIYQLDVLAMCRLLTRFNKRVSFTSSTVDVQQTASLSCPTPDWVEDTRYSLLIIGSTLRKLRNVRIPQPGGCRISSGRPIDIHIKGFEAFGARIQQENGYINATLLEDRDGEFELSFPSVGATENLILFATTGSGHFILHNAAVEPEIESMVEFLNSCGAQIRQTGQRKWSIDAVKSLQGSSATIIPDRIEAISFMILGALLRRNIEVTPIITHHMDVFFEILSSMKVAFDIEDLHSGLSRVIMQSSDGDVFLPVNVATSPYPGFPTDAQPMLSVLCLQANGISTIEDTVFIGRADHVSQLQKLGADISVDGNVIKVNGCRRVFTAETLRANDIRSGIACVLGALISEGRTLIENSQQIERGYEELGPKLRQVGIRIERVSSRI
ncbi:MAG: UDP-N-acetylglucosamine 1-carboxyvinyltransferase [Patescibacteria group bacterium]|jgi:UDP-N-acetylglucosamine 1-carboxyvinyltransferase